MPRAAERPLRDEDLERLQGESGVNDGKKFERGHPRAGGLFTHGQCVDNLHQLKLIGEEPKRIVICADGTWNSPVRGFHKEPAPTNVWLLFQLIAPRADDERRTSQLAYYHAGVGTRGELYDRLAGGLAGWGLKGNILACYNFLVEHYRRNDELYLFGFSRGAYTARSLAGLIRNCGIINPAKGGARKLNDIVREAWHLYRDRGADSAPTAKRAVDFRYLYAHPDFNITCIGVWDTVGSLGLPVRGLVGWVSRNIVGFHDVTLSSHVNVALQALAIDEQRGPFTPTLWVQQPGARTDGQVMEQVWFPGVHADIGGGERWNERGLANVTLRWMVNRLMTHCPLKFDLSPLVAEHANVMLHDSMSLGYRLLDKIGVTSRFQRTIDGGLGDHGTRDSGWVTTETLHSSVQLCMNYYATRPFLNSRNPYSPANVENYSQRIGLERPVR